MIGMGGGRSSSRARARPYPPLAEASRRPDRAVAIVLLVLRAFASGAVALTGTEAIATGVPAFKPPEARNAAATLGGDGGAAGHLFIGITFVAQRLRRSCPIETTETVIAAGRRPRVRRRIGRLLPVPDVRGAAS